MDIANNSHNSLSSNNVEKIQDKCDFVINNLLELPYSSENSVAKFMKYRYENGKFYTWAGQTLIAVHPFQESNNDYENEDVKLPSVSAVVSRVWFRLSHCIGKIDQAIVISGDSGSGKTFSACLAIKYIAEKHNSILSDSLGAVLWKTWCSVPLLTAFGNAATSYNNNSSRYGKLMQLQFENDRIVGASIQVYMLEKCRVSLPNPGEGNFHIFHQLLENVDNKILNSLHLYKNIEYKIVPKLENSLKSTYEDMTEALEILRIPELQEILTVLAIILNLGNVNFVSYSDSYVISLDSLQFVERAALLLETDSVDVTHLLTNRIIVATSQGKRRFTSYSSPFHTLNECSERRNCLMSFLYNKLFLWLVKKINHNICKEGNYKLLGILDIYGFEIVKNNMFEQLCINYANERLQLLFVKDYLRKQQQEIQFNFFRQLEIIDDSEYRERISLLDGPVSVFSVLNEECTLKRFNDDISVNLRLTTTLKGRKHFITKQNASTEFTIKHYAGQVKYQINSMCSKNSDKVPEEMLDFLFKCKFEFLKQLLDTNTCFQPNKDGSTLLKKFQKSLDSLMYTLQNADLHFIKCIKPNLNQQPKSFDMNCFLNQIRANGITEILKLGFQKFSISFSITEFKRRFCASFLYDLKEILKDDIFIGKSHVYMTQEGFEYSQKIWNFEVRRSSKIISQHWKKKMKIKNQAAHTIQKFLKKVLDSKLDVDPYKKRYAMYSFSSHDTSNSNSAANLDSILPMLSPTTKVQRYVDKMLDPRSEGDIFSLNIENILNNLKTKSFSRTYFRGDGVISKIKIFQIPYKNKFPGSCIPFSCIIAVLERPRGLLDLF